MANIKIINVLITIAILSVLISVNADEVNCNKAIKSSVNAVKNNFEGGILEWQLKIEFWT